MNKLSAVPMSASNKRVKVSQDSLGEIQGRAGRLGFDVEYRARACVAEPGSFRTGSGEVQGRAGRVRSGQCMTPEDVALIRVEATQLVLKSVIIQWINIKVLQLW